VRVFLTEELLPGGKPRLRAGGDPPAALWAR